MSEGIQVLKFKADDISCTGCAMDMETVPKEKEGIIDTKVVLSDGIVSVRHDPQKIDGKGDNIAVRKLGFRAKVLKD